MVIRVSPEEDVTVVSLNGRFDARSAPEAERAFGALLNPPVVRCLLDFSGVEYISSGGLRAILMLSKALGKVNSRLKLCGLNPFVSEVFEVSRLSEYFEIHANRTAAIAAFSQDGAGA